VECEGEAEGAGDTEGLAVTDGDSEGKCEDGAMVGFQRRNSRRTQFVDSSPATGESDGWVLGDCVGPDDGRLVLGDCVGCVLDEGAGETLGAVESLG
jgi:hypothetical protein